MCAAPGIERITPASVVASHPTVVYQAEWVNHHISREASFARWWPALRSRPRGEVCLLNLVNRHPGEMRSEDGAGDVGRCCGMGGGEFVDARDDGANLRCGRTGELDRRRHQRAEIGFCQSEPFVGR